MSRHHYDHIRNNEKFHRLVARKRSLTWSLTIQMLVVYYAFILVVAFKPEWLGVPIAQDSIITWGIPIGILVILFTFAVTGVYVHRANGLFDDLTRDVVDASHTHVDGMSSEDKNEGAAS